MFLNSLAVVAVVYLIVIFVWAFRKNYRVGYRAYNIPMKAAVAGTVGLLWLIFGGT